MDNIPAPTPQVYPSPTPWYKRKILWIYILILILIPVSFYLYKNYFAKTPILPQPSPITENPITNQDLPVFIKASLQSQLIPPSFNIQPTLDTKGTILDPNRFNSFWNSGEILASASIRYGMEGQVEDKNILLTLPNMLMPLTATSAATIADQYFLTKLQSSFKCGTVDLKDRANTRTTLCEDFGIDQQGVKRGLGIINPIPGAQKASIFYCEIYPNSPIYGWKSCSIYKSETGWQ